MVIFDRDGTLIDDMDYKCDLSKVVWIDGARRTLLALRELQINSAIATNQSGVARGLFTLKELDSFHGTVFADEEGHSMVDFIEVCPHYVNGKDPAFSIDCKCRKPGTLMVERLIRKFEQNRKDVYFVGNTDSDKNCAYAAGIEFFDVRVTPHSEILKTLLKNL